MRGFGRRALRRGRPLVVAGRNDAEALCERYRRETKPDLRPRWHALWLLRTGWSARAATRALGAHERSVRQWVAWHRAGGVGEAAARRKAGEGTRARLTAEQQAALVAVAAAGRFRTAAEAVAWVKETCGAAYTVSGMHQLRRRLRCRPKVPRPVAEKADPQAQEAWKGGLRRRPRRGRGDGGRARGVGGRAAAGPARAGAAGVGAARRQGAPAGAAALRVALAGAGGGRGGRQAGVAAAAEPAQGVRRPGGGGAEGSGGLGAGLGRGAEPPGQARVVGVPLVAPPPTPPSSTPPSASSRSCGGRWRASSTPRPPTRRRRSSGSWRRWRPTRRGSRG